VGKWTGLLYDTGKDLEGKGNVRRIVKEERLHGKGRLIGKTNREDFIGKTLREDYSAHLLMCQVKCY
jgi:hypothetical protein